MDVYIIVKSTICVCDVDEAIWLQALQGHVTQYACSQSFLPSFLIKGPAFNTFPTSEDCPWHTSSTNCLASQWVTSTFTPAGINDWLVVLPIKNKHARTWFWNDLLSTNLTLSVLAPGSESLTIFLSNVSNFYKMVSWPRSSPFSSKQVVGVVFF